MGGRWESGAVGCGAVGAWVEGGEKGQGGEEGGEGEREGEGEEGEGGGLRTLVWRGGEWLGLGDVSLIGNMFAGRSAVGCGDILLALSVLQPEMWERCIVHLLH